MTTSNISIETATLKEMKIFATANEIVIAGDKRVKENWAGAIERWQFAMNEAKACLEDAEVMADKADQVAEVVVVKTVEVLTSPKAVSVYKSIFHLLALVIALVLLMSWKLVKWCWAHRGDTALAQWIVAFSKTKVWRRYRAWIRLVGRKFDSEFQSLVTMLIVDKLGRVGGPVSWV